MGGAPLKHRLSIAGWMLALKNYLMEILLTRKQKRIIFLTRVYINARKRQVQNVMDLLKDDTLIECVDNVNDKDVFDFPFRLYNALWGEDEALHPETVENEQLFRQECEAIFQSMPEWMQYGRKEDRIRDIQKIYQRVNRIAATG